MNNTITKQLANHIRNNDLNSYAKLRYQYFDDGEEIVFESENFNSVDFSNFGIGFFRFKNCSLIGATGFSDGVPVFFQNCNCQNIDLCDQTVYFEAENSDFRNMQFNNNTSFAKSEPSQFTNCQFSPSSLNFIKKTSLIK